MSIYLDHAATSPVHPEVIDVISATMQEDFGNPSSIHRYGREARRTVDQARKTIADTIGARVDELVFTSGGTESDNLAIMGVANAYKEKGKHVITTTIEHHAVLNTFKLLEKQGFDVTYLSVNEDGLISLDELQQVLREDTILVSIMLGNNEVGTIQPLAEVGKLLAGHQAFLHTDAVQAVGVLEVNVEALGVDLLSFSAHKINGPKGIGALYVKQTVKLTPLAIGGEQERKRRAGTENVPGMAGFAKACEIATATRELKSLEYRHFKQLFLDVLKKQEITYNLNGLLEYSLPHILNLSFPGTEVESLLVNLDMDGVSVSSGSACTAGSIDPSHVLVAMYGKNSERVRSSIRFSFGLYNTKEDIQTAAERTAEIVQRLTK